MMDKSKINQSEIDFSCGIGNSKVNLNTGRLLYEAPLLSVGANSFQIGVSLLYNSHYQDLDFTDLSIGLGNGWKLNIEEYVFPYKVEYNMEGYNIGDYIYIDSLWQIHRFVKYKEICELDDIREVYYDTSGSGLRLVTGENRYSEIYDENKNIIRFDLNGKIIEVVSALNPEIVKSITYENNLLKSIEDTRKENRKINFLYDSDKLTKVTADSFNISFELIYNEKNELEKLVKSNGNNNKDYIYFRYNYSSNLTHIIDAENLKTLNFIFDILSSKRVIKVKEGVMKKESIKEEIDYFNYINESGYVGEDLYLDGFGYKISGYTLSMPNNYIKNVTSISYHDTYTDLINDKNITHRYFFNTNKFTSSILEMDNDNDQSYRALAKTCGWQLSNSGTSDYLINGQNANIIVKNDNDIYEYNCPNISSFRSAFEKYENSSDSKYKYNEYFVVSFWMKTEQEITSDVYAKAEALIPNSSSSFMFYDCTIKKTLIDKAPSDCWQYVTIPVQIRMDAWIANGIKIKLEGSLGQSISIADVRIALSSNRTIKLIDSINEIDMQNIASISYIENGEEKEENISSSCYLKESDLFITYKNLYNKIINNLTEYDFVYCNGTKVKSVSNVSLTSTDNITINLNIDEEGITNYFVYACNRLGKEFCNVVENHVRFHKEGENDYYYELKTATQNMSNINLRVEENNCSKSYEWYNSNGTFKAQKDEYSVVKANYYDDYGNLLKEEIYNDDVAEEEREYLTVIYDYGDIEEKYREMPQSIISNNIERQIEYNEPDISINYNLDDKLKTKYNYDSYKEKILSLSNVDNENNNNYYKNELVYDSYGRLSKVYDSSGRAYGFIYNVFGDVLKYYENKKLVLRKEIEKENGGEILREYLYNNSQNESGDLINRAYVTETKIDKYGKIIYQENNDKRVNFIYQDDLEDFKESKSLSKIKKIVDPYEGQEYEYFYDDENRPCGYETTGNNETKARSFLVRQIGEGDTEYHFSDDEPYIASKIIKDNVQEEGKKQILLNPRVNETTYVELEDKNSNSVSYEKKAVGFKYEYDGLGRLSKKINKDIVYLNRVQVSSEVNTKYKVQTTLIDEVAYKATAKLNNDSIVSKITYKNTYFTNENGLYNGNLKEIEESGDKFVYALYQTALPEKRNLVNRIVSYSYDAFNRLIKETKTENNVVSKEIEYVYSSTSDKLKEVKVDGIVTKEFSYSNGRRTRLNSEYISYDNYGNVTSDTIGSIEYDSRNYLSTYSMNKEVENNAYNLRYENKYFYNHQGVRYKKQEIEIINGAGTSSKTVVYYLDGSRILGEDWFNSNNEAYCKFRYYYDAEGICGFACNGNPYTFIKDTIGNITKLVRSNEVIGEYVYDAWGNCEVKMLYEPLSDADEEFTTFVLYNNPFRWKSHYLDLETNLYYINGRYYSPLLMMYLNADNIERTLENSLSSLDRHTITLDNSITFEENKTSIFTDTKLFVDPTYDPISNLTWWEVNGREITNSLFVITLFVTIALMCNPTTFAFGLGMLKAGLNAAISGAVIGGILGCDANETGSSFWDGVIKSSIDGFIGGFVTGVLTYCASQAITSLCKPASSRCTTPGNCFICGTIVLTKEGNKKIEDIVVGDEVWAYDKETGKKALKKVVNLFRNTTRKWIHLLFKLNNNEIEEIVCTEEHPFYVKDLGWVSGVNLLANDEILLYNNATATLTKKEVEELEIEETTYNFEVEDYHTYYVGKESLLVHNACNPDGRKGCQAHQDKIDELFEQLKQNAENLKVKKEIMIRTPTGSKTRRFVDVGLVDENNELIKGYQVGVSTKKGLAVSRENKALKDIEDVIGRGIVEFKKYK